MQKIEDSVTEVKLEHITFLVISHFKPDGMETIDQKLVKLLCENSKNMITKPIC